MTKKSTAAAAAFLQQHQAKAEEQKEEVMSVSEWLTLCKTDKKAYANVSDRLTAAIGEPRTIDTRTEVSDQERRAFGQKTIQRYEPFAHLYDKEEEVSQVVDYIKSGSKGILVLRGPVGSGKTDIAGVLEKLIEKQPIYVLKCKRTGQLSDFNDSPLCLISHDDFKAAASSEFGIPKRYLKETPSSWVSKRLEAANNVVEDAFEVAKVYPSEKTIGIGKLDPGDKNSPDLNALIGEVDMNKAGDPDPLNAQKIMSEGDPDAYSPGLFSISHQGMFHGAEFLRNNASMVNKFLEAVTEGKFTGDRVGTLPINELIVFTTNDPVLQDYLSQKDSDAFNDRATIIDVGYTLRETEEVRIYDKLIEEAGLEDKPCAPGTKELLANFAVQTRLKDGIDGALKKYKTSIRARVLNGELVDGDDDHVPELHELQDKASPEEGLEGFSTRSGERTLKDCFNARAKQGIVEADTILMIEALQKFIDTAKESTLPAADKPKYRAILDDIRAKNLDKLDKIFDAALADADNGVCQLQADKYYTYAEAWVNKTVLDEDGEEINRDAIDTFLRSFESKIRVTDKDEYRESIVTLYNAEIARIARSNAKKPAKEQEPLEVKWTKLEPIKKMISAQHKAGANTRRAILEAKSDIHLKTQDEKDQYNRFYENMDAAGYTKTMIKRTLLELRPST